MTPEDMRSLLDCTQTIAVVGMSNKTGRPAHEVPKRLMNVGFTVIPVNPNHTEVLGSRCYPTLADVPVKVDLVDVFRRSQDTPPIARDAVAVGAGALWLQLGIVSEESRRIAEEATMPYVEDSCLAVVVGALGIRKSG